MKIALLSILLFLFSGLVPAEAKKKEKEAVPGHYNRNSLSVVTVLRGDQEDAMVSSVIQRAGVDSKFDHNNISTRTVDIPASHNIPVSAQALSSSVVRYGFGKEILSYLFCRTSDGMMTDALLQHRGRYNATDQDIINMRASQVGVGAIGSEGQKLISSSYLLFLDYYEFTERVDSDGDVTWSANVKGTLYKMDFSYEDLDDFYTRTWIYPDDSDEVRQAKSREYDRYPVFMSQVASVSSSGSGDTKPDAVVSAYSKTVEDLENVVPEWNVASTVYKVKPIQVKVGLKEGIRNADRFRAYSYREDADGKIVPVKRGYIRATEVVDNRYASTGSSACSKFYQISGNKSIEEGMTIRQSNDLKIGVALAYEDGSMGNSACLEIDYIMHIGRNGSITYGLLSLGTDITTYASSVANFNSAIGAGYGLRFLRHCEFMPYMMFGTDYMSHSSDSDTEESESAALKKSAYYIEGGLRLGINIYYPLQMFFKVSYNLLFSEGIYYQYYNETLVPVSHKNGAGLQAGFKWTF